MRQTTAVVLMAMLLTAPLGAAEREVIRGDWRAFQEQVAARGLKGRAVRITVSGGRQIKTNLLNVADAGLEVRGTRSTRQWQSAGGQASIPKEQVNAVQFGGRTGNGRLLGTLVGAGAGAGIGAAVATGHNITEGTGVILIPVGCTAIAVIGALVGYYAGRSRDRPGPEFVLTP
jgi:hypothetical protein